MLFHPCSSIDDKAIYVDANTRIQVLETMMDLPTADKQQSAAFIVSASPVLRALSSHPFLLFAFFHIAARLLGFSFLFQAVLSLPD